MVCEKLWPDVKMIDSLLFWIFSEKKGIRVGLHCSLLVFTEEKNRIKKLLFGDRMPYSTICSFHKELPLITRSCLASYISPKSYQGFACSENFLSLLKWFNQPSLAERPRTGSNRIPFSDEGSDARESSDFVAERRRIKQPLWFHLSHLRCNETLSWRRADQRGTEPQPPDLQAGRSGRRSRVQSERQSGLLLAGMGDPDPRRGQVAREVPGGATTARKAGQNWGEKILKTFHVVSSPRSSFQMRLTAVAPHL